MNESGVEWVAAALAPWAISPHPNFSESNVRAYRLLALVSELRHDELDRYGAQEQPGGDPFGQNLVDLATSSLLADSQREAVQGLWTMARRSDIPAGARAAAALYASVGQTELEDPEGAAARLEETIESIGLQSNPERRLAGSTLIVASLRLQRAVRLFESDSPILAAKDLAIVRRVLSQRKALNFEDFEVSPGISWNAKQVQLDILETIRAHELALRSRSERLDGESWVELVRSRPTWIDVRGDWKSASRDNDFVKGALSELTRARTNKTVFHSREPSIQPGAAALLSAELSGDVNGIATNREALGMVRILRSGINDTFNLVEAVRLIRQARSKAGMDAALDLARSDWPANILHLAVSQVVTRPSFPARLSEADIRLISTGADVLTREEVEIASDGVWFYLQGWLKSDQPSRSTMQDAVRAVGRLASQGFSNETVATRMLEYASSFEVVDYTLARALESVIADLDWNAVSSGTRATWIDWATDLADSPDSAGLTFEVLKSLDPENLSSYLPRLTGLDYVVAATSSEDTLSDPKTAATVKANCISALEARRLEAIGPSRSFGGFDEGDVSVMLALKQNDEELWAGITSYLLDKNVDGDNKARALNRLSQNFSTVPDTVKNALRVGWDVLADSSRSKGFFNPDSSNYFPEALRLGVQLDVGNADPWLETITEMAGDSDPKIRAEGAASVPLVSNALGAQEWGQSLLLQLTRDRDASVRADSARALVLTQSFHTRLHDLVDERLVALLHDRSIRLPLLTLHGFQALLAANPQTDIERFTSSIHAMASDHESRIVRKAAEEVLRRFEPLQGIEPI